MTKKGYYGAVELHFKPESLKKCPSAQLQLLGSLSSDGKCKVNAATDTILYCVDKNKVQHKMYTI